EKLNIRLLGYNEGIYEAERDLLTALQTRNPDPLPLWLFINAYFENYDPTLPQHQRMRHNRALRKTVATTYYPGFLNQLETIVTQSGAEHALRFVYQTTRRS